MCVLLGQIVRHVQDENKPRSSAWELGDKRQQHTCSISREACRGSGQALTGPH